MSGKPGLFEADQGLGGDLGRDRDPESALRFLIVKFAVLAGAASILVRGLGES